MWRSSMRCCIRIQCRASQCKRSDRRRPRFSKRIKDPRSGGKATPPGRPNEIPPWDPRFLPGLKLHGRSTSPLLRPRFCISNAHGACEARKWFNVKRLRCPQPASAAVAAPPGGAKAMQRGAAHARIAPPTRRFCRVPGPERPWTLAPRAQRQLLPIRLVVHAKLGDNAFRRLMLDLQRLAPLRPRPCHPPACPAASRTTAPRVR